MKSKISNLLLRLLINVQLKTAKIKRFAKLRQVAEKNTELLLQRKRLEQLSKLYATPDEIMTDRFFRIMEMEMPDLSLLKRKKEYRISQKLLSEVWDDLREYYYEHTTKDSFDDFKRKLKNIIVLGNTIKACHTAETLVRFSCAEGFEILRHFGIESEDIESIHRSILKKETELDLLRAKEVKTDNNQKANYNKFMATINIQLPFQINPKKTSLAQFVGIYEGVIEKNKIDRQNYEKQNNKK